MTPCPWFTSRLLGHPPPRPGIIPAAAPARGAASLRSASTPRTAAGALRTPHTGRGRRTAPGRTRPPVSGRPRSGTPPEPTGVGGIDTDIGIDVDIVIGVDIGVDIDITAGCWGVG